MYKEVVFEQFEVASGHLSEALRNSVQVLGTPPLGPKLETRLSQVSTRNATSISITFDHTCFFPLLAFVVCSR